MSKININGKDFTIEELNALIEESKKPTKSKQAFYPNGACIYPPKVGEKYYYWISSSNKYSSKWNGGESENESLIEQRVFLTEEARDKAMAFEKKHLEMVQRVYQINAENDWVADWSDKTQDKYLMFWSWRDNTKDYECNWEVQCSNVYMCKQACDWLMSDEVSDEDFKAFLKIYD